MAEQDLCVADLFSQVRSNGTTYVCVVCALAKSPAFGLQKPTGRYLSAEGESSLSLCEFVMIWNGNGYGTTTIDITV